MAALSSSATRLGEDGTMDVVRAHGVHKSFGGSADLPVRALRGLDLEVASGEFVAVVGPSGCGKSTLVNALAGLLPIDSGEISIAGEPMSSASDDERTDMRLRHVGIVFQQYNLLSALSALDNVALACRIGGAGRRDAERRARDLLSLVALGTKADTSLGALSGGQRQRVGIARALANEPTLLLADEPTGALDSTGAEEIGSLLTRLHDGGLTIVLVTHDLGLADTADRIERMSDGRLVTEAVIAG
ncbi:MAG: ABC transporter ATP-binding protein [Acidimicrobiales bacterium]|nr:ABC transporter ATP-binding protein [Acidimicrobiales bacterium]